MSELEAHLCGHGFGDLQAAIWARFLEEVMAAIEAATRAVNEPGEWARHVAKEGALLTQRRGGAEVGRRLPSEEGLTCALTEALRSHRVSLPEGHYMRTHEVFFESEARMPSARRTGRKARRIDVMAKSHAGPGAPFVIFEAKLVVSNRDVGAYLGREGLGCFTLPPDAYEADRVAAMIAYVVDGTSENWWARIEGEMARGRPAPLSQRRVRHSDMADPLLWSRVERPALAGALPLNVAHLVLRFEAVRREPR